MGCIIVEISAIEMATHNKIAMHLDARILPPTPDNIARAAEAISAGQLVAFPTETCYGWATDALNIAAVDTLATVKGRNKHQPISVLVADVTMLAKIVRTISAEAQKLMAQHWPGALTIIFDAQPDLSPWLCNDTGGIGVRISPHPIVTDLISHTKTPITATSANLSGLSPATTPLPALVPGIAYALDGGLCDSRPSTVVDARNGIRVIRQGAIAL